MRKQMTKLQPQDLPSLFAAFVVHDATNRFSVYLVNNSSTSYANVTMLTGGFLSADGDVIQTSKITKEKGALQPYSALLLDESDYDELDFVIWYELTLADEAGHRRVYQLQLPKYGVGYEKAVRDIPVLGQKGMPIVLS